MSDLIPFELPDLATSNSLYVVGITTLYPGNHKYVGKFFTDFERVPNPYDANLGGVRNLICELTDTVHELSGIKHGKPWVNPNSGDIERKLENINEATDQWLDYGGGLVPGHIHYAKMSLFSKPVAENMQFTYGLMMSYGDTTLTPIEFAVLLPEKRLADNPAVLLSNNYERGYEAGLQTLIDMINFGWNFDPRINSRKLIED